MMERREEKEESPNLA